MTIRIRLKEEIDRANAIEQEKKNKHIAFGSVGLIISLLLVWFSFVAIGGTSAPNASDWMRTIRNILRCISMLFGLLFVLLNAIMCYMQICINKKMLPYFLLVLISFLASTTVYVLCCIDAFNEFII